MTLRALELFCGIGGFAAAVADRDVRVVGALDQDAAALAVYRLNFPDHPVRQADLERITPWELTAPAADFWWLSPPCQPYCERGNRRDLDDPRAASFVHLLDILARIPAEKLPRHLALENVAGFAPSQAHNRLLELLTSRGYFLREHHLCPTELGIPSQRPRYYLTASRTPLAPAEALSHRFRQSLNSYLDVLLTADPPDSLRVPDDILTRYGAGLRIVDTADPEGCTTCFTSGYGRSIISAGAYLAGNGVVRRFSPEEIARLLHFPKGFRFPTDMSLAKKWRLVGNSLSVMAVQEILRAFPEFNEQQEHPSSAFLKRLAQEGYPDRIR